MQDIRLKTRRLTVGGQEYEICCNMNVVADVQEMHGVTLSDALNVGQHGLRTALEFAAAMINDAADAAGRPERYTPRQLGRILPPGQMDELYEIVSELVGAALASTEEDEAPQTEGEESKNA